MVNVVISGRHMSLGSSIQSYITDRMQVVDKYINRLGTKAHAMIDKKKNHFIVEIVLNNISSKSVVSHSKNFDVYKCVDSAIDKVVSQLKRRKRDVNHKSIRAGEKFSYDDNVADNIADNIDENGYDAKEKSSAVIREDSYSVKSFSVAEAVLQMNNSSDPAFVFINRKNGHVNMLYHRKDSNIGWLDFSISSNMDF